MLVVFPICQLKPTSQSFFHPSGLPFLPATVGQTPLGPSQAISPSKMGREIPSIFSHTQKLLNHDFSLSIFLYVMASRFRRLHIVVLKCYAPSAKLVASHGDLTDWFRVFLTKGVERHAAKTSHCIALEVSGYNVVFGEYPGDLDNVDAVVVTGSGNGAYEPIEWIQTLEEYIQSMWQNVGDDNQELSG